jgi:succinoglycan biosynthesis transport protein ExoP
MLAERPPARASTEIRLDANLASEESIGFQEIRAFIVQESRGILKFIALGLLAGVFYLVRAAPVYVASSKILLDQQAASNQLLQNIVNPLPLGTSELESQIQVIESERIARAVITGLGLQGDPYLAGSGSSLPRRLLGMFWSNSGHSSDQAKNDSPMSDVFYSFEQHLSARRIEQSYVIEVSYSSANPVEAAKIVNSVTAAYVRDKLLSRVAAEIHNEPLAKPLVTLDGQVRITADAVKTGTINVEDFPAVGATVLTSASPPLGKSWPKANLILAFSGLIGLFVGLLVAIVRKKSSI